MKKINNKILFIALVALAAIFVFSRLFRASRFESNVRTELVTLDTAAITEIRILPSSDREQGIRLSRSEGRWIVEKENKKYNADAASVKNILGVLGYISAERMVSRKKEKWETFNVGEGSTNVSVYYGTTQKGNLNIGKSGFKQGGSPYGAGSYTYVRLSDEDEVYAVDGFLESTFNRPFREWRDKSFLRIPPEHITKISFRYPADSSFVLEKRDSLWFVRNLPADEGKVNGYLRQLSSIDMNAFADDFTFTGRVNVVIQIEGPGGLLETVEAWKEESSWILRSSLQKNIFFSSTGSSAANDLLVGADHFLFEGP